MTHQLPLDAVDVDGAIRETAAAVQGDTRAGFLAKAGLFGGGLVAASALGGLDPAIAGARPSKRQDVAILNFALTLEHLEAKFYAEAKGSGALSGELLLFAQVVAGHERRHVLGLKRALGSQAVPQPRFDFRGTTQEAGSFAATAQLLEDTGVAAYKGQAPRVQSSDVLDAALAIHAVEARHAAWIRDINGAPPAPDAFDAGLSKRQVLAAVAKTRFIV